MAADPKVAYFSMEIALDPEIPTYSGGLGVLAGDTIRSAADLKLPFVAVTLLYREGYFYQRLDPGGWQREDPVAWAVDDQLEELPERVRVAIEGRDVEVRAWLHRVRGLGGHEVLVYFLDTDLEANDPKDRALTGRLYGGDARYRLAQEVVLGIGGVRMLHARGHESINRYHMNEGHAALLTLELLDEEARRTGATHVRQPQIEAVQRQCVFTTHTPVPAGHDQFPLSLMRAVLGHREISLDLEEIFCCELARRALGNRHGGALNADDAVLNMTLLALNLSGYVNGVAKKHSEIARHMFAEYKIDSITNGVHAATWVSPPFQRLFDAHVPGWREDNFSLRSALALPADETWQAHVEAKHELLRYADREANAGFDVDALTIGFARRATAYKRADLVLSDPERLVAIAERHGPLQLVFAGKAHPADREGKLLIQRVLKALEALRPHVRGVYLKNHDLALGALLTAGVDLWLNTPLPPNEASGTSGMKAALNGVPSLSILDGWWIEGCIEGITGWAIGGPPRAEDAAQERRDDALSLYEKLEAIAEMFYRARPRFIDVMRHAIALNGSFYNTQRMVEEYVTKAYVAG